jgi:hypothetical protein
MPAPRFADIEAAIESGRMNPPTSITDIVHRTVRGRFY